MLMSHKKTGNESQSSDVQSSCIYLLSTTRQPRKEPQIPTFGSFHKSPSWRRVPGQTDARESMVGWRGMGWRVAERQLEREEGKDHVGEVGSSWEAPLQFGHKGWLWRLETLQTDVKTKRKRPKWEFDIVMSVQLCILAMLYGVLWLECPTRSLFQLLRQGREFLLYFVFALKSNFSMFQSTLSINVFRDGKRKIENDFWS